MARSLKSKNNLSLYGLMVANLIVFFALIKGRAILTADLSALSQSFGEMLPVGFGLIITGILNAQFSAETKSRIVFLRWHNSLPGCEAFTRYIFSDPRIDHHAFEKSYGHLPSDPKEQNVLWYKMYKSVESDPAVMHIHQAFLFTRDYTCLALIMAIVFGCAGIFQIPSFRTAIIYFAILALQFVLADRAARNHGRRFVTTVLAIKSTG